MILLKTDKEVEMIGASGKILSLVLSAIKEKCQIGTNLIDLENLTRQLLKEHNAKAAFLGYQPEGADHPYPAALCLSLNDVVVHGVPRDYCLKDGDLLKV